MKKIFLPFFLLVLFHSASFTQTVNEKPIVKFSEHETVDMYSFRYDPASGTYVYAPYDTVTKTARIFSNKGDSQPYGSINTYNIIFDKDGNYYAAANDNTTDTTFRYFFLKNGQQVQGLTGLDQIDDGWLYRDGLIYFTAKDKGKYYFVTFNTSDGTINKSKPYDDIRLVYFEHVPAEGEPVGQVGFTKDGKPYYQAEANNEKFIVIGDEEQKHYSDIDYYYTTTDRGGELVYIAKSQGKFYEVKGNSFVVQGDKEYKKFDYIYGPILIDKNNNPVYVAVDSAEIDNPQRVMVGNNEGKTYKGGIYDLKFSPSGKLAYIANMRDKNMKYKSMAVIDGKEGKKYVGVNSLTFSPGDEPIYTAQKREDRNKSVLVVGKNEMSDEYDNILDPKVLPDGKLFYVGANFGDWDKKLRDKYYVHIGDDTFGPYDGMQVQDYSTSSYILSDKSGNYTYAGQRVKSFDPYVSTQILYGNNGKSDEFDYFQNVNLYKGKAVYSASKVINPTDYVYNYKIYYGTKQLGSDYDAVTDYKFDNDGTVTFVGYKNKAFWWVEITL